MAKISQGGKKGGVFSLMGKTTDSRMRRLIEGHLRARPAPNQRTAPFLATTEGDKETKIEMEEALKKTKNTKAPLIIYRRPSCNLQHVNTTPSSFLLSGAHS